MRRRKRFRRRYLRSSRRHDNGRRVARTAPIRLQLTILNLEPSLPTPCKPRATQVLVAITRCPERRAGERYGYTEAIVAKTAAAKELASSKTLA